MSLGFTTKSDQFRDMWAKRTTRRERRRRTTRRCRASCSRLGHSRPRLLSLQSQLRRRTSLSSPPLSKAGRCPSRRARFPSRPMTSRTSQVRLISQRPAVPRTRSRSYLSKTSKSLKHKIGAQHSRSRSRRRTSSRRSHRQAKRRKARPSPAHYLRPVRHQVRLRRAPRHQATPPSWPTTTTWR